MRFQVAIDRVSVEEAGEMISQIGQYADIIEIGTSLIKDYGLEGSVKKLRKDFPHQCILADIKTCDEGAYEFQKTYEAGADIPTVMGFSSMSTIRACADVAKSFGKEYMIDLLEVSEEKMEELLRAFPEAIFCIHLPSDKQGEGLEELIKDGVKKLNGAEKIAAAGGVTLETVDVLKENGITVGIVGSAVSKAPDRPAAAKAFAGRMHAE